MNYKLGMLPLLLMAMFASCSPAQSEQISKNAPSEYELQQYEHIDWSDLFKQKETNYFVFFYSQTCSYCHEIMGDVQSFIQDEIVKMYLLDIKASSEKVPIGNDTENTIGTGNIDDLFIKGTPSIVEINEGIVTSNIAGKEKCLTFLNNARLLHKT